MKRITLLVLLSIATFSFSSAQQSQPITYRVVAVNNVDPNIKSVSNQIDLYLPVRVYVPSAFTPNGDGLNDHFGAVGEGIHTYKMLVFNRWGEIVFSSSDVTHKWDGTHNGEMAPSGVYTYVIEAHGAEIGKVKKSGAVALVI